MFQNNVQLLAVSVIRDPILAVFNLLNCALAENFFGIPGLILLLTGNTSNTNLGFSQGLSCKVPL